MKSIEIKLLDINDWANIHIIDFRYYEIDGNPRFAKAIYLRRVVDYYEKRADGTANIGNNPISCDEVDRAIVEAFQGRFEDVKHCCGTIYLENRVEIFKNQMIGTHKFKARLTMQPQYSELLDLYEKNIREISLPQYNIDIFSRGLSGMEGNSVLNNLYMVFSSKGISFEKARKACPEILSLSDIGHS